MTGDDEAHFKMDRKTGVIRLTQGVTDRLITPVLRLQVMVGLKYSAFLFRFSFASITVLLLVCLASIQAFQEDDPMKYSVATVLVRILAVNQFYPEFDRPEYRGFVIAGKSPVSLVNTYGSKALMLHVRDQDFRQAGLHTYDATVIDLFLSLTTCFFSTYWQGFNPMIYFSFSPTSNYTDIYQVTQGGLLIAQTCHLKPKQKHVLEVSLKKIIRSLHVLLLQMSVKIDFLCLN